MALTCPSCSAILSRTDTTCPSCGYGYKLLDDYHRNRHDNPLHTPLITDTTASLTKPDLKKAQQYIKLFHSTFPDLFFAIYLESRSEKTTTKGLWLLNNISFTNPINPVSAQQGFLLYIDPEQETAALSYGLSLAQYVSMEEADSFLTPSVSYFSEGLYPQAIKLILDKVSQHLIATCPKR